MAPVTGEYGTARKVVPRLPIGSHGGARTGAPFQTDCTFATPATIRLVSNQPTCTSARMTRTWLTRRSGAGWRGD
jgi:hypothetical protein